MKAYGGGYLEIWKKAIHVPVVPENCDPQKYMLNVNGEDKPITAPDTITFLDNVHNGERGKYKVLKDSHSYPWEVECEKKEDDTVLYNGYQVRKCTTSPTPSASPTPSESASPTTPPSGSTKP